MKKVLCIATAGKGGQDDLRMRALASKINAEVTYYCVDRSESRLAAAKEIWNLLKSSQWDLVYQEGTGIAGGINLILAAWLRKQPFIVSSGDPVGGFFYVREGPIVGSFFEFYERLLYKTCLGFVGWTPYLTGAAMKMGARNAATVEGAVDLNMFYPQTRSQRLAGRQKYGVNPDHLVCGVIGSLNWMSRQSCCQGYELVETLKLIEREDVSVLIVGDGTGKSRIEAAIPEKLKSRVILTGRVPKTEVVDAVNAMDIGFVTQIPGQLGNYRLSTKLPEYLACGVPVAMTPSPGFFDYASSAGWALPPLHPASVEFHQNCAQWIEKLSWDEVQQKAKQAPDLARKYFDNEVVGTKFREFVHSLLYSNSEGA
jgi:Glycosyl transferases group 1